VAADDSAAASDCQCCWQLGWSRCLLSMQLHHSCQVKSGGCLWVHTWQRDAAVDDIVTVFYLWMCFKSVGQPELQQVAEKACCRHIHVGFLAVPCCLPLWKSSRAWRALEHLLFGTVQCAKQLQWCWHRLCAKHCSGLSSFCFAMLRVHAVSCAPSCRGGGLLLSCWPIEQCQVGGTTACTTLPLSHELIFSTADRQASNACPMTTDLSVLVLLYR